MEFEYPTEAEQFRAELRAFLDTELPDWWNGLFRDDDRIYPFTREFCMKLAERDWLTMSWPAEHGGVDADVWTQMVVREEMWA
ncbi:MAG: acyl-CoA dehydrogenase family protein, partial [Acidimicrobiales bacterium]